VLGEGGGGMGGGVALCAGGGEGCTGLIDGWARVHAPKTVQRAQGVVKDRLR
jgi:hypothetical protein